jgi:hypothetical protein
MSGRHTNALVVASARERGADHVIEHRDQSFVLDVFEVAR